MYFGSKPYGLEVYLEHKGDGSNMYRGETFGQPRTLMPGDILANGLEIAESWSEEGNEGVGLHFTNGTMRIVAARIPLLLTGGVNGKYPSDLEVGDIFETADVVLAAPDEIDSADPRFEIDRREVEISITGGLCGHTIGMPKDLIVALTGEVYPPSTNTKFGQYVVEQVLKIGARARRNLPNYGRLDDQPEWERITSVFDKISTLQDIVKTEFAAYQKTLGQLKEQCQQLTGVELMITGLLYGRGGTRVYKDNPDAWVEDMLVEVSSASVNTDSTQGSLIAKHQPFIEIYGRTVDGDEQVSAWLDVGEFGVSFKDPNAPSEQEQQL